MLCLVRKCVSVPVVSLVVVFMKHLIKYLLTTLIFSIPIFSPLRDILTRETRKHVHENAIRSTPVRVHVTLP